jgi:hypothetical protein
VVPLLLGIEQKVVGVHRGMCLQKLAFAFYASTAVVLLPNFLPFDFLSRSIYAFVEKRAF